MATYERSGAYLDKTVETDVQTYTIRSTRPFRATVVTTSKGQIINDGTDTVTITVELVDALEVVQGTDPANASTLAEDGTVSLAIDGAEVLVSLTDGTGTKGVTTTKSGGSTIDVETVGYDGGPIEGDRAAIEVMQA